MVIVPGGRQRAVRAQGSKLLRISHARLHAPLSPVRHGLGQRPLLPPPPAAGVGVGIGAVGAAHLRIARLDRVAVDAGAAELDARLEEPLVRCRVRGRVRVRVRGKERCVRGESLYP